MVLDIEFERFMPEIDADRFAAMTETDGGVDWHCSAYFFEHAAY
jgi:hypothetical protein